MTHLTNSGVVEQIPRMNSVVKVMGRPSLYSPDLAEEICERIATTPRGLDYICNVDPDLPDARTVARWLNLHPDFCQKYIRARERQADLLFDESLEIADDSSGDLRVIVRKDGSTFEAMDAEFVKRSELRVKTRLTMAAQLAPAKYGRVNRTELSGPGGAPIQVENRQVVDLSELDPIARDQMRELIESSRARAAMDVTPREE